MSAYFKIQNRVTGNSANMIGCLFFPKQVK